VRILDLRNEDESIVKNVLEFSRLDQVEAKHVDWIWQGRLARGKLTLLAGEPGIGKSQTSLDLAARISIGSHWPDVEGRPVTFSLQIHLEMLGNKLTELGDGALIIMDPITSYMGKIDGHQTVDVRTVLEPLATFAEKHDVAVLAISHPPKATQSKALHAVTGSLAYVAAARMVFVIAKEPETERRLLLPVKNNLGPPSPGLGFSLGQRLVNNGILASHVMWDSAPVTTTADEAIAATNHEGPTAMNEAREFLREELAHGPQSAHDIKKVASSAGISLATLRRAKGRLGVKSSKPGISEGWVWELPGTGKIP
jgi:AAA domain-containing protein